MKFIDSNVLVYVADDTDAEKQRIARSVVEDAISSDDFLVSAQVLNEFSSVLFKKLRKSDDEVDGFLEVLEGITATPVLPQWVRRAVWIKGRYDLQFYDSLIVAAAEAGGCDEILTEDLSDGQVYCGVKAVNPFKVDSP